MEGNLTLGNKPSRLALLSTLVLHSSTLESASRTNEISCLRRMLLSTDEVRVACAGVRAYRITFSEERR